MFMEGKGPIKDVEEKSDEPMGDEDDDTLRNSSDDFLTSPEEDVRRKMN